MFFFYALKNLIYFITIESKKLRNADFVFFFPYFHTGGAERVHLNIVKAVWDKNSCVIFCQKSATNNFKSDFEKYSNCIEINRILNKKNKFVSEILSKFIINTINNSKTVKIIFGCNTNFYYSILPKISQNKKTIDLIHALSNDDNREIIFANSAQFITTRIVISKKAKLDIVRIYEKYNIKLQDKIKIIENGIEINNNNIFENKTNQKIKIGFVGRWSEEKRPRIFLEIAKKINSIYPNVQFIMAGTGMKSNIDEINQAGIQFLGEITDKNELENLYSDLNFILITSIYEGFPMVFMESMMYGVIPISTNVGGIPEHIKNSENGILINNMNPEITIINDFVVVIQKMIENKQDANRISNNAFDYANRNFGIQKFNEAYKHLLST